MSPAEGIPIPALPQEFSISKDVETFLLLFNFLKSWLNNLRYRGPEKLVSDKKMSNFSIV